MSARLRATLLAAALVIAFTITLFAQPTGYLMLSPGPTVDVLGMDGSHPIVTIEGHKSYPDNGQLRMLTVYEMSPGQSLTLGSAIKNWLGDDTSVYPANYLYPPGTTSSSNAEQGAQEMTSAQDLAKAAALRAIGVNVPTRSGVQIVAVDPTGPSNGKIEANDLLVDVGSTPVGTASAAVAAITRYRAGASIPLELMRGGKDVKVSIKSVPKGTSGAAAKEPRVGISLGDPVLFQFHFPFKINISIPDSIMGPSAGMMFALTIYDKLTPGSLTKGHVIAGTGTIDALGNVGPIGGIDQKIRGAQRDGAQLFLAPASNCNEVVRAHYDAATMKIVKVSTLAGAIKAINTWTANPKASLPGCS